MKYVSNYNNISFTTLKRLLDEVEYNKQYTFEIKKKLTDIVMGLQPSVVYDLQIVDTFVDEGD